MQFKCNSCGQVLSANENMAGQIISCPACGGQIQVPANEVVISPPIPEAPVRQVMSQQPYGQPPQPYAPQDPYSPMPRQQPYGYASPPEPKIKTGLLVGLIVAFILVIAGIGAYFIVAKKGSPKSPVRTSSSDSPRIPIVTTEEGRVKSLVTSVLKANKRGDYGSEYWVSWASSKKLIAPTSWEIVDVSVAGTSATVVVQVDSSNGLGMKISRLWKFWLTKETGTWKVFSIDGKD